MKQQTSSYPILVLGCIVPICLCGFFVWLPIYLDDLRLSAFANNLYTYPLPPGTTTLDNHSELSKVGNGNNCYYKAEQSMVSTLPRAEIEQYYEDVMLPRVSFVPQWDKVYEPPTTTPIDLAFNESKSNGGTSYFTLSILDFGFSDTGDIRCQ
jgi:hypothetical protein